jgi:hypothetical protein
MIHLFEAVNSIKEMEIGKHGREKVAVNLTVIKANRHPIDRDTSAGRLIEAGKDFQKSRFSAPVATRDENRFTLRQFKIKRFQGE